MKLSLGRAFLSLKPPLCVSLSRPICSSSQKPQIPLSSRPPISSATLSDLRKWHNWAKSLSLSVGSSFVEADNGPDSTLLLRELKWLIEDAVQEQWVSSELGIEGIHQNHNHTERNIKLRVGIEELYELWKQRIHQRKPFQYIVGCEHWRDFVLSVQEGVLIPRPETEIMVDLVADVISDNKALRDGLWADLGTGSGAIAVSLGRILGSDSRVIATDLSSLALAVADYNIQRFGLQEKIELRQGSWFEPLKDLKGKLSGVVSNPPYIPTDDIPGLQAEVGRHEPRDALDGGTNGMNDLLHLCNGVASMLVPGGFFAFETNGERQCKHLVDCMENNGKDMFCDVKIVSDYANIARFVTGYRRDGAF